MFCGHFPSLEITLALGAQPFFGQRSRKSCARFGAHVSADFRDKPAAEDAAPSRLAERARVWTTHELARTALGKIKQIGDRHGIDVLPVKGVVTARRLYADVSERPMQDVDVRVTRRSLRRVRELASEEGLKVLHDSRAYENLVFDIGGFMLEVEAHVGPPGVCAITIEQMLARASLHDDAFGFPCLEPELHDHALLLAVNAFKDKLVDAMPYAVRDLDRIVRVPDFSPTRFAALAREGRVTTLVWIVASWLALHGEPASGERSAGGDSDRWREILAALGEPPRKRYGHAMLEALDAAAGKHASFVQKNALRVGARAASDSLRGRVRALGSAALHVAESTFGRGPQLK